MLGVWAAPGDREISSKGGGRGRSPPPAGIVVGADGAAQTPKIDDLRAAPPRPCIRNASVCQSFTCDTRTPGPKWPHFALGNVKVFVSSVFYNYIVFGRPDIADF